ncbi:molybdopterin molybdotransferase MoeA [Haloarchaeobius salinus]|uniref:molybdopterin molybdotransferase MoeA n=1 Tax=Haloarchaeobius salinus TaxID=1198298 RepID=UPI00210B3C44|nr:molybdopterin molybdotransferase MoeA [Haloarchaeobius salinus]
MDERRRESGFRERTRIDDARERLRGRVSTVERTETVPVADADGRTLAAAVTARRAVPGESRASVDGFAVAASTTFGASDRSPALLDADGDVGDGGPTGGARRVDAGDPLPSGADAVVPVGGAALVDDTVEVFDPVAVCDGVAAVGSDVAADQSLYEPGRRLRPPDLGLLRAAGVETVTVRERPRVAVVPVGDDLVDDEPGPGESVETDSLTVIRLVERWGGVAERHGPVADDAAAIAGALRDAATDADIVATTGGSGLGESDRVPDALASAGSLFVHGIAATPGESLGLGSVDDTPVVVLPGGPAACVVGAMQFLRPAATWADGREYEEPPTGPAMLARKVPSEPGVRTYVRVRFDAEGGQRVAVPIRTDGPLSHSSVGLADGWIEIREGIEGLPEGDLVAVQRWGWSP